MTELTLYLIRHAQAAERGPDYPDDGQRPLVDKGHRQAERLALAFERLGTRFDRIFSSPLERAAQTAKALRHLVSGRVEHLESLAEQDYAQLLEDLGEQLRPGDETIACVGHEPYLSELASTLLTGEWGSLDTRFRKAAAMILSGVTVPGRMRLEGLLTSGVIRRLMARGEP